jgi:pyruvate/2-oxoglutarate dehydrogenase complex dihydrolipoamide dehydrogenase (E3) component
MPEQFDAIVIGAGQSGGPLSTALANAGHRTALVEREHVGGTCINEGCTPTKTMIASGRVAYLARRGPDYGVHTGSGVSPITIDMARVRQRKRDVVRSFRQSSQQRIERTPGLDLLFGDARFVGPKTVEVRLPDHSARLLQARRWVFINAGARPARPNLPGLDSVPALDSTSIMELDQVPEHLLVLGGGYVGLEFGQLFRRLGSAVSVVQRGARLLGREDPDVADAVARILREDGVDVLLSTAARAVRPGPDGSIRLTVSAEQGERELTGSHLLVAAGRVPNSDRLDLASAGVETDDRGFIKVDDQLRTTAEGVYALGDIKGGPAFTHISYDDWRIIRTNLLEGGQASTRGRLVPYTVFIDPQLGRVGLTEQEARASGRPVRVARLPLSSVARAIEVDEQRGFLKAVVDAETGQILGGAVLGLEGGELMAMLEIAMLGQLPYTTLKEAIFAHPTLAEAFNNLFYSFED